jgi:hypothetical protein
LATTIQIRRDTSVNWGSVNPTPAAGELCFDTTTKHWKIGDGVTAYASLPDRGLLPLSSAANDVIVGDSTTGNWLKKTIAEFKTILGLGSAAYTASGDYAVTAKGVTNGDSHDHSGGDGAQIDHGGLAGLSDDDHTQYIKHALATAENDFLVASGAGAFVKKTLAETRTILGIAATVGGNVPASVAADDMLFGDSTTGNWLKKTLAQAKTTLGLSGTVGGNIAASTAANDFLVGDGTTGNWMKKTLAEIRVILSLDSIDGGGA